MHDLVICTGGLINWPSVERVIAVRRGLGLDGRGQQVLSLTWTETRHADVALSGAMTARLYLLTSQSTSNC